MHDNRTRFTAEERRAAVDEYLETDHTAKQIAERLGCNAVTLRKWIRDHRLIINRADNSLAARVERLGKIAIEHGHTDESLMAVLTQ